METRILLFGQLGQRFGRYITLEMQATGCTVGALRATLATRWIDDAAANRCFAICVDQRVASESDWVRPDQEIAVLPPLSGG